MLDYYLDSRVRLTVRPELDLQVRPLEAKDRDIVLSDCLSYYHLLRAAGGGGRCPLQVWGCGAPDAHQMELSVLSAKMTMKPNACSIL